MPDLLPEGSAAFPAPYLGEKNIRTAVVSVAARPTLDLLLHQVKCLLGDNAVMMVLHEIRGNFPLVLLYGLGGEIDCECLLQQAVPAIFFIFKDALHSSDRPLLFTRGRWPSLLCELFSNCGIRIFLKEKPVNLPLGFCLFMCTDACSPVIMNFDGVDTED